MISGRNFKVEANGATFHEFGGAYYGRDWQLFPSPGCNTIIPGIFRADDTADEIRKMVEDTAAHGAKDMHVVLSSHYATLFYLGGGVTEADFARAEEADGEIRVKDVQFGKTMADLIIVDVRQTDKHVSISYIE